MTVNWREKISESKAKFSAINEGFVSSWAALKLVWQDDLGRRNYTDSGPCKTGLQHCHHCSKIFSRHQLIREEVVSICMVEKNKALAKTELGWENKPNKTQQTFSGSHRKDIQDLDLLGFLFVCLFFWGVWGLVVLFDWFWFFKYYD